MGFRQGNTPRAPLGFPGPCSTSFPVTCLALSFLEPLALLSFSLFDHVLRERTSRSGLWQPRRPAPSTVPTAQRQHGKLQQAVTLAIAAARVSIPDPGLRVSTHAYTTCSTGTAKPVSASPLHDSNSSDPQRVDRSKCRTTTSYTDAASDAAPTSPRSSTNAATNQHIAELSPTIVEPAAHTSAALDCPAVKPTTHEPATYEPVARSAISRSTISDAIAHEPSAAEPGPHTAVSCSTIPRPTVAKPAIT